ncbi:MAG: DUF2029 domain-containing protein [bacterium]|nr:DUF2029 domain-containing protein [bacterium]
MSESCATTSSSDAPSWRRLPAIIVVGTLLVGLGVRAYLVVQPPASSTRWDHHEYVRWGVLMHEEGLASLYDHAPPNALMYYHQSDVRQEVQHLEHFICNYPPLAAYPLYAQIKLLAWFDPTLASNTTAARVIYALLSILGDVLIAAGCYALVWRLTRSAGRSGAARRAAALAFGAIMLAPPFIIDSAWWTQTDSWVLAAAVWMVWAMLGRRWLTAGLLWGVALGLKTQGILFAPIWLFALLQGPQRRRVVCAGSLAVGVLVAVSLPFSLHSGPKWFQESYIGNLFEMYETTTLKAFNVWYVDLLLCEDLDANRLLWGLKKDTWGKMLLACTVIGSAALLLRRRRSFALGMLVTFTAVTLLAAITLPTRVHERYIILPIPFLVVIAMWRPRLWIALLPFIVAASFQMTALDWLGRTRGAGSWPDVLTAHRERNLEQLTEEYEYLRTTLPAEEFAALLPPDEHIEQVARTAHLESRAEVVRWEWALTMVELLSAAGLFAMLLLPLRASSSGDSPDCAE